MLTDFGLMSSAASSAPTGAAPKNAPNAPATPAYVSVRTCSRVIDSRSATQVPIAPLRSISAASGPMTAPDHSELSA